MDTQAYEVDVMQTVRDPLLVLDGDLRVKVASRSFYKTFKVRPEQTLGRFVYELGNGQWNVSELRKLLEGVLPTDGEFNDYEVEHDFPDIGPGTLLLNARRLHHGDVNAKLILLAIEDITGRRTAELEIARQRAWFQTTLTSIGDAVIVTDAHARVTFMNPVAEAMTGWSQQEAGGKPLHDVFNIFNEDTRKLVESPVSKAIRMGAIVGLANHTVLLARDGAEHQIDDSASPIREKDGGEVIGVVMVFHDITDRRKAESLLEASEVRYRRLFEAAHDGILMLNTATRRIIDVNPFILDLLDYPREYFIGKELWEIGIFRDKEACQTAIQMLHEKGSIRFENLPLQDRNGRAHPVEIVANIYREDRYPVIQCNIRDIGERVQFEHERSTLLVNEQASRMEAEAANHSKDLFLATLSHEVRTPLSAIMGWASILRGGKCSEADMREGMDVIDRNCRAQAQLIEDVLDISRIVSGKMQLQICPCELVEIINAAMDVVRPAAEAKGIRFETDLDATAVGASCDVHRMQQVIWNLLANAVKFTPRGSVVRISLSRNRSAARIEISDNGQGIGPELLPHVFDRFRQADSSTRRKLGGLGLGLSIAKHIVELHGGTIHASSEGMGLGATFTIDLPVRAVQARELGDGGTGVFREPPELDLTAVRLDGLRVLVVDDEADARRLLSKVLGEAGAAVAVTASVAEALEAMANLNPHVLLSDIAMPDQDGYDLIRQVRSAGHSARDLPAVALTAFAHKDDRLRVLMAGFQVHVAKPIDPHELTAVIASLTGRTGQPVAA